MTGHGACLVPDVTFAHRESGAAPRDRPAPWQRSGDSDALRGYRLRGPQHCGVAGRLRAGEVAGDDHPDAQRQVAAQ